MQRSCSHGSAVSEHVGLIPGLAQWVKDPVLPLLWLWCRPAAAALIRPFAGEPPYAMGVALKKKKKEIDLLRLSAVVQ